MAQGLGVAREVYLSIGVPWRVIEGGQDLCRGGPEGSSRNASLSHIMNFKTDPQLAITINHLTPLSMLIVPKIGSIRGYLRDLSGVISTRICVCIICSGLARIGHNGEDA